MAQFFIFPVICFCFIKSACHMSAEINVSQPKQMHKNVHNISFSDPSDHLAGLRVTVIPSAVVREGQTATLTCTTSCPLPEDTVYTWYLNGRLLTLPGNQNKHLVLKPVGTEHAGNYSCSVVSMHNISSSDEALIVIREHDSQYVHRPKGCIIHSMCNEFNVYTMLL